MSCPDDESHVALTQINITLPNMPCEWISIDALDISGDVQLDMVRDTRSGAFDHHFTYCHFCILPDPP